MDAIHRIQNIVNHSPAVLFLKGDLHMPLSESSYQAAQVLKICSDQLTIIDVTQDAEIRAFLPKFRNWSNFPQLYLQGELIGGAEIIQELASQGELCEMVRSSTQQMKRAS